MGLSGNDTIDGRSGNDKLYGNEGNDRVYGGAGDDTLYGGEGNDYLQAGSGNDKYIFSGQFGLDKIYDTGSSIKDIIDIDSSFDDLIYQRAGNN